MKQIFDIKKKLYMSLLQIKREQVDAIIKPMSQHYHGGDSTFKSISYYNSSSVSLLEEVGQNTIRR